MAIAGRKPKPPAIRLLEGHAGHRPINMDAPKPRPIAPSCPTWLERDAKREWRRVAPALERLGLLTEIDGSANVGTIFNAGKVVLAGRNGATATPRWAKSATQAPLEPSRDQLPPPSANTTARAAMVWGPAGVSNTRFCMPGLASMPVASGPQPSQRWRM